MAWSPRFRLLGLLILVSRGCWLGEGPLLRFWRIAFRVRRPRIIRSHRRAVVQLSVSWTPGGLFLVLGVVDLPCRFGGISEWFCLLVFRGDLRLMRELVGCGNAIEGLITGCQLLVHRIRAMQDRSDLHGLGYLRGSYTPFGSCSCWTITRI